MTVMKVWLGSVGPQYFDDAQDIIADADLPAGTKEASLATNGQLFVDQAPVLDENVVRLIDLTGSLSNATPLEVETVPAAGVGTKSSRDDHVHGGVNLGDAQTITGLKTFNLGANAPFAVDAASLKVTNLDADKLDGRSEAEFAGIADTETIAGAWTFTTNPIVTNTAPGMVFTDTTAAAKSLTLAVDANFAQLRESAGASGSLLTLDLANNRVGIGTAAPTTALQVSSTGDVALTAQVVTTDASGTIARSIVQSLASTAAIFMTAHGAGRVATRYGIALGSYAELVVTAGNGLMLGTTNATPLIVGTNNVERLRIDNAGLVGIGIATPATILHVNGRLTVSDTIILSTSTPFTNGAAAAAGTLLNAPAAGNPTKWIPIDDNGTTRYIPAW